jgi:double-stranded uracil-DNA glycosylase
VNAGAAIPGDDPVSRPLVDLGCLRRSEVPAALADLHRALAPGAPVELVLFDGDGEHQPWPDDDFPGRRFSLWPTDLLEAVVTGAGFTITEWRTEGTGRGAHHCILATRADTLPDMTGAGMRLLVVGLNPSLHAARAGVGYVGPGNRFWPAALEAGLVSRPADPAHALRHHGMGMTDLVKRATPDAAVLSPDEYRRGRDRLERLVAWLQPGALCVVGLAGWRAAVDRRAAPGPQPAPFAGVPVYLLGSTSGRNARWRHEDFVAHLRAAARLAAGEDPEPPPVPVGTGRSPGPTGRGPSRSPVR